jgi:hypothetical protein
MKFRNFEQQICQIKTRHFVQIVKIAKLVRRHHFPIYSTASPIYVRRLLNANYYSTQMVNLNLFI